MKKLFLTLLFLILPFLVVNVAECGVTIGNTGDAHEYQNGSTHTWTHNNNGSILVVMLQWAQGDMGALSHVKFNGVTMTAARTDAGTYATGAVYYLVGADQGSYSIVATWASSNPNKGGSSVSLIDAGDLHAVNGNCSESASTRTATVSFPVDGATVDCLSINDGTTTGSITGGQTTIVNALASVAYPSSGSHSSYDLANGTVSWSTSGAARLCLSAATFTYSPPATVPKTMGVESANIGKIMQVDAANI